jgi:hypothetical protein
MPNNDAKNSVASETTDFVEKKCKALQENTVSGSKGISMGHVSASCSPLLNIWTSLSSLHISFLH